MTRIRDGYWFVPKTFGWGATPATWQGWLVTVAGVAAIMAAMRWVPGDFGKAAVVAALVVAMVAVAAAKTDGGWRWRWGGPAS